MTWPLSQDYNEAIQSPAGNFADADLRSGEAVCNALGLPVPYSGNFADVYQVRCPDGGRWAVKCFTREAPGLRERYAEISKHLATVNLPFTVDFTYLEQGIRVAGRWYPALKMQWVEGLTLNQFVRHFVDKPPMIAALLQVWGRMAQYLRAAEVGHCDLQHGNVLLTAGAAVNSLALKLIDYDGMWVAALAGKKSGEFGHPCYQHPQRTKEATYNIDVDRFPLLLVATALRALKEKGQALWDKYDNGDNVLFKESDLLAPLRSHLFLDLLKTGDPVVRRTTEILVNALRGSLETVPLLEEVMPELASAAMPSGIIRRAPTPAPAVAARQTAIPAPPVAAPAAAAVSTAPDPWDFDAAALAASDAGKYSRNPGKRRRGVPVWAWVAAFGLLLFGMGASVAALMAIQSGLENAPAAPDLPSPGQPGGSHPPGLPPTSPAKTPHPG